MNTIHALVPRRIPRWFTTRKNGEYNARSIGLNGYMPWAARGNRGTGTLLLTTVHMPENLYVAFVFAYGREDHGGPTEYGRMVGRTMQTEMARTDDELPARFAPQLTIPAPGLRKAATDLGTVEIRGIIGGLGSLSGTGFVLNAHRLAGYATPLANEMFNNVNILYGVNYRYLLNSGLIWAAGFTTIVVTSWAKTIQRAEIGTWMGMIPDAGWLGSATLMGAAERESVKNALIVTRDETEPKNQMIMNVVTLIAGTANAALEFIRPDLKRMTEWLYWITTRTDGNVNI